MTLDFTTFILSVSSAAFMGLGLAPRNGMPGGEVKVDLELAKQNIALLELLAEKTKNNLTSEEAKLLEGLLYETRTRFVEVSNKRK